MRSKSCLGLILFIAVIFTLLYIIPLFLLKDKQSISDDVKLDVIQREYFGLFRIDSTNRLLVSKKYFDENHTSKIIDITVNNEKYLGGFEFEICDTLKSNYLVGEKFLNKNGVYLFVHDGCINSLYTYDPLDIMKYKELLECIANKDFISSITYFEYFCKNKILSNSATIPVLGISSLAHEAGGPEQGLDVLYMLDNAKNNENYSSRNKLNLIFF